MKEQYVDGRCVLVIPICKFCDTTMVEEGIETVPTDEGYDSIYYYRCPNCGYAEESVNLRYPYQKFIPMGT